MIGSRKPVKSAERISGKLELELQDLADGNDYGTLFATIKKDRGYSIGNDNATYIGPTLDEFLPFFRLLFQNESCSSIDCVQYFPKQHEINDDLAKSFTKEELRVALQRTKMKSAPGIDEIPAEYYRYGGEMVQSELLKICNEVLASGEVPQAWKDAIIIPIFKKGDYKNPSNYRGISLTSHAGKIFERLILNRLIPHIMLLDDCIPDTQFGFMRGRGTTDALALSRRLTELTKNSANSELFKCYVDLTKAYDKVDRKILWALLKRYGIPDTVITTIKNFHEGLELRFEWTGNCLKLLLLTLESNKDQYYHQHYSTCSWEQLCMLQGRSLGKGD
jgi:hypothetical protein